MNKPNINPRLSELTEIQAKMYQTIDRRREQLNRQIQIMQDKYHCEYDRHFSIQNRRIKEQITHPYNENFAGSGRWRELGYCIDDLNNLNLDDIKERQHKRRMEKQEFQNLQSRIQKSSQDINKGQYEQNQKGNKKIQQIPWKLMRKLRQHDVAENKQRISKAHQYQKNYIKRFHQ